MSTKNYTDEVVCLGKGGVFRLSGMTKDSADKDDGNVINNPIPFLEGVEIYAQEPQGKGYCYVPKDSKCSVIIICSGNNKMNIESNFPIRKLQYSPLGSYLLILTVYEQGKNENNLGVYKFCENSIDLLFSFPFRTNSAKILSTWPPYRWSNNELFVFKVQDTSISIYKGNADNIENPINTLKFSRSIQLSISNEIREKNKNEEINSLNFSVVAQHSTPNIDIHVYHAEINSKNEITINSVGNLGINEVQTSQVLWNYNGNGILLFAQTEGETLGKSYFGSSSLHLLRIQNAKTVVANNSWNIKTSFSELDTNNVKMSDKLSLKHIVVVPPEQGPVNDVSWSPVANEFLLCKGIIPPELTLNNGYDGSPKVSFGKSRRNTIRWNPSGKWFAYGGFGNLAGDLDIWDASRQKLIGQTNASCCITLEWSIDGRFLLASTTSPRLRVDNAIRIFRYNGELLKRVNFDTLNSAYWAPCTHQIRQSVQYRSVSPGREFDANSKTEKQIYRPKWASSGFAERMRAARDFDNIPKVVNVQSKPRNEFIIPGLPTLEASAAAANASFNRNSNSGSRSKSRQKKKI